MSTYTFPTPPNPQVYRLAAQKLAMQEHVFSCMAIRQAGWDLGLYHFYLDLHAAQYEAVFGPEHGEPLRVACSLNTGEPYGIVSHRSEHFDDRPHPFWNKTPTPERQQQRILALLFMAELCENPT